MKYPELSTEEVSARKRLIVLLLEVPIFLGAIPAGIGFGGRALDRLVGLPVLSIGMGSGLIGLLLGITGVVFALWSIVEQFMRGRGTPAPQMPSQELVTGGPYAYSRNPMTLGTFLMYGGLAIGIGSLMALVLVVVLTAALLWMIRSGEEAALETRFGEAYREYRRQTPFFFPRVRK